MQLTLSQIRSVTTGATRVTEEKDGIHFYRFTQEQEDIYRLRRQDFYESTFSTPGIRLRFRTNSPYLTMCFKVEYASPRSFFAVDVSVDGVLFEVVNNYSANAPVENYGDLEYPYDVFCKRWNLGAREKEIQIYLPWSVKFVLQELTLEDSATIIPVIPEKKALCFGDSITHGADAQRPSSRYISRLCDYLGAAEYNKAICGEFFWPELAKTKESFAPDYITVAYGTNDWSKKTPEELQENCIGFYRNLAQTYPDVKLIAITPLWRGDQVEKNRDIPLTHVHDIICDAVKDNPNATVIRGYDLVPHDPGCFGDLRLHPNDKGFDHYYHNLVKHYIKGE